jgi:HEAT repeat protein
MDKSHMRRRPLPNIRAHSAVARLNGRSAVRVYEAAKAVWEADDLATLRCVIYVLKHGRAVLNRTAAADALNLMHQKAAIPALEQTVDNKKEHSKVRGEAAESLAHNHRERSHRVLLRNLYDPSKEVRFWCAYSLSEMGDCDAILPLIHLAATDHRTIRGFWSVSSEAKAAIRIIRESIRNKKTRAARCLSCSKKWKKPSERQWERITLRTGAERS